MTFTLKTLGMALVSAGLMATAHAGAVSLSAVIDFEEVAANTLAASASRSQDVSVGETITNQYAQFGLEFSGNNLVRCSSQSGLPECNAPRAIAPPQSGPNFLMNDPQGIGFSIKVLDGFSLSTMKLDIARNSSTFFIKFFDANNVLMSTPVDAQTGSDFTWIKDVDLGAVSAAVRRIDFSGGPTSSFAIDFMRFDYVANAANVPEPAAMGLVALALAGVGLTRRRKA